MLTVGDIERTKYEKANIYFGFDYDIDEENDDPSGSVQSFSTITSNRDIVTSSRNKETRMDDTTEDFKLNSVKIFRNKTKRTRDNLKENSELYNEHINSGKEEGFSIFSFFFGK